MALFDATWSVEAPFRTIPRFQGISAVENMCEETHILNHDAIPAACFTHPEIAMVGPTEEQARERAEKEGFEIGVSQGSFKANSKALAEGAGDGIAKVIFRKDNYEIIAVHIVGIHAADLIQECANSIASGSTRATVSTSSVSALSAPVRTSRFPFAPSLASCDDIAVRLREVPTGRAGLLWRGSPAKVAATPRRP